VMFELIHFAPQTTAGQVIREIRCYCSLRAVTVTCTMSPVTLPG
jgi:hypothetical protein